MPPNRLRKASRKSERRKDRVLKISETGNSNEASKEHAKKPSIRIVDAQKENRESRREERKREKIC